MPNAGCSESRWQRSGSWRNALHRKLILDPHDWAHFTRSVKLARAADVGQTCHRSACPPAAARKMSMWSCSFLWWAQAWPPTSHNIALAHISDIFGHQICAGIVWAEQRHVAIRRPSSDLASHITLRRCRLRQILTCRAARRASARRPKTKAVANGVKLSCAGGAYWTHNRQAVFGKKKGKPMSRQLARDHKDLDDKTLSRSSARQRKQLASRQRLFQSHEEDLQAMGDILAVQSITLAEANVDLTRARTEHRFQLAANTWRRNAFLDIGEVPRHASLQHFAKHCDGEAQDSSWKWYKP